MGAIVGIYTARAFVILVYYFVRSFDGVFNG